MRERDGGVSLRKNIYFIDNRVHKQKKDFPHQENEWEKFTRMSLSIPRNIIKQEDEAESSREPIAMKNVQIPIMPRTNYLICSPFIYIYIYIYNRNF